MKIVIAGGRGDVGTALVRHWANHDLTILTRSPEGTHDLFWDGKTLGDWTRAVEGADVVVNLAGRTVNCRYTDENLAEMMSSRVDSTRVMGEAIAQSTNPPAYWLQASTATIYAHRFDAPNDEETGIIGGEEPGVPPVWAKSIDIAKAWEETLFSAHTPRTKRVALRSAMTMSPIPGGVFAVFAELAQKGLGGRQGDGRHYVSWVHEDDFCRSLDFILERQMEGPINISSPHPLPQADFSRLLNLAVGATFAPPIPVWALELGAFLRQTETELILKSRRVVPKRLLDAGFEFRFPQWAAAAKDLAAKL